MDHMMLLVVFAFYPGSAVDDDRFISGIVILYLVLDAVTDKVYGYGGKRG